jgi:hypothetical protein
MTESTSVGYLQNSLTPFSCYRTKKYLVTFCWNFSQITTLKEMYASSEKASFFES